MRVSKVTFKKGIFRAYKPLKQRTYIASEEMAEVLSWHMRAEYTEQIIADWLTLGRDFGGYQEMCAELRTRFIDEDLNFSWWWQEYRRFVRNAQ